MGQMTTNPPPQPFLPAASAIEGRVVLRPYQAEALEAIRRAYEGGMRRLLLVLPVGSGKTHIAARIPELIGDPRLVYCAHRHELLDQTLAVFRRERPDRRAGIERAHEHPVPGAVTAVASIQSLYRPNRLERYRPEDWPAMVTDEAHRSVADSYLGVFRHFRHLPANGIHARSDGLLLGMTGTSRRTDEVGLGHVYESVPFTRTLRDMIEEGYLVPLRGYLLRGGATLEAARVRTEDGDRDFDPHPPARTINTPERNRPVVDGPRHPPPADGPTRLYAGKTDAIVIDFVDNTHKHATSLISLPTLFGLPARFDLKGTAAHAVIRQFEDVAAAFDAGLDADVVETIRSPQDIPRFFHEIDLLKIAGLPPRVSRLTEFAWQRMPDGTFAITIPRPRPAEALQNGDLVLGTQDADAGGQLEVVENAIGHFEIRRRTSAGTPQKLTEHPDLETALQAADGQIRERYRDRLVLLSKRARWRGESATDKQLRLLEALGQLTPRNKDGIA